jgi:choloylglycine hydrolase
MLVFQKAGPSFWLSASIAHTDTMNLMKARLHSSTCLCLAAISAMAFGPLENASACTGISLRAADGGVVVARTVEWALGDAKHDRLVIFPRGRDFTALTPDGPKGRRWTSRHGFVTITAYDQDYGPDGLNEAGLYVGMYYFPGFAEFAPYDPSQAGRSLSVGDFMQWMLSSFRTVAEVREHLDEVTVVNVEDPRFGGAPLPFHWKIADASGACMILEISQKGRVQVHDAFLGVITNSPDYSWHLTNLRNHIGLSPAPRAAITLEGLKLSPLGGGSGFVGLPGDFTPPSRFIRAAAFTASARPLKTSHEAVFEAFRILDSFNIPAGTTAPREKIATDITGATQITTAADLQERVLYFHTMSNRRVRTIDLKRVDFTKPGITVIDESAHREEDVKDLTPAARP